MPIGPKRSRGLAALSRQHPRHRYLAWRAGIALAATLLIAAIPLAGILRIDFWGGRHIVLGEEVDLVTAAKAFAFPFLAINIVIVIVTRFWGRYLCGFACPGGALARAGEVVRYARRRRKRILGTLGLLLGALLLAAIVFVFWVDPAVFVAGSPSAKLKAGAFFTTLALGLFLGGRFMGLRFCRDLCPSGIYFALLGPQTRSGVEFAHPENCTDCKLCVRVCPVDLEPREMASGVSEARHGLYPDGLSNHALCWRCGDCIRACETTTGDEETPLRMGPLSRLAGGAQEAGRAEPGH